jgi:tetratricopeptide (TPR) repeat protein
MTPSFTRRFKLTTLLAPAMILYKHQNIALRFILLCLAVFACTPHGVEAQSSAATSGAAQTTPPRVSAPAKPAAAPAASTTKSSVPLTIELYSLKVRFENDGTGTRQFDVRVKAGTDEGVTELKTLSFDYDSANEKLELRFLRVTKANGSTVEGKPNALADDPAPAAKEAPAFSELREAHVTVPAMAPGDTLSYEEVISLVKPPAPGEFWFSHDFLSAHPAIDEEVEINVPAERTVHIQTAPQFPPKTSTAGGRKTYSWKRLNTVPTGDGSAEPAKPPDVALTTFANWDALAKWFAGMDRNAATSTADLAGKSKDLVADQKTDADKIETLYEYVAKQIHLLRIPAEQTEFQIHDAAKVLSAGYGDELDKCALLAAMLGADGFHADVVLLPTGEKFDPELPWPGAIAHAAVRVAAGKDTFWMDPSLDTLPFRLLPPNSRGKNALVASSNVPPYFAETPPDPPFPSTQDVEINANVTSLGKLTARIHYALRGDNEYALRTAFERTPQSEWNSVAQTMATLDGLHGTVLSVKSSDPTATRDPFTLDFVLVSADFLDWSRPRVLVPLFLPAFGLPDAPADSSKPVQLGSPLAVTAKLELDLPANDFPHAPVGAAVKRDYAEYHSEYTAQEHAITAQRTLRFISRELPPGRRGDFQAFAAAVQADESQGLAVENIIPGIPEEATANDLMQAGASEMQDQHFGKALQLFQQVAESNPQQANLWLNMGSAQMQLGKYDDAIASFQKQLEANPKDESVNALLGEALYDEKKYDQAEAAFKKQIELKPLDENAYAYLGAVYIAEKQFDKADAELEKAAVLSPDSAIVHLRLGEAELELRKTDAALADFEKASTLSPSPLVANEIAYALADHKTALDRAKEYADAAIGPTENSLSQLDLQHVTPNNLVATDALAAFWDTLAWVYFQQGKLAEAEPLIEAAWHLNQTSDSGDHLAQVYEARGEKDLAIHAYEQAIAAGAAPAETRERLRKLLGPAVGSAAAIDAGVKRAAIELVRERTVSLGKTTVTGRAEFVVLVEAGPNGPVASDAKFLAGDDKLASIAQRFHDTAFPPILPRGSRARIVLRGAVTCSAKTAKCDFVFDRPRDLLAGRN